MPVRRCILTGRTIRSLDQLYDQLSAQLQLPEHFGRNLDALWDTLSSDVEGPFEVVWKHAEASRKAMGGDFERVMTVFQDLREERKDFKLTIEP